MTVTYVPHLANFWLCSIKGRRYGKCSWLLLLCAEVLQEGSRDAKLTTNKSAQLQYIRETASHICLTNKG